MSDLRKKTLRLASELPPGDTSRRKLLGLLLHTDPKYSSLASFAVDRVAGEREARSGQKWWTKQVVGERVRIRWSNSMSGGGQSLTVEELPGKPFKRRLRKADFPIGNMHFGHRFPSAFLMENLTQSAMFGRSMNYERAVLAFQAAIDAAIAESGDQLEDWQIKQLNAMPYESEVFYLEVEPGDYEPIRASGKDFSLVSEWGEFQMYSDSGVNDPYEGMRDFYKEESAGGARKFYKLVSALDAGGQLAGMTLDTLKKMLDKNKIAYRYVPSVWR